MMYGGGYKKRLNTRALASLLLFSSRWTVEKGSNVRVDENAKGNSFAFSFS
jgi:hypothetical protein